MTRHRCFRLPRRVIVWLAALLALSALTLGSLGCVGYSGPGEEPGSSFTSSTFRAAPTSTAVSSARPAEGVDALLAFLSLPQKAAQVLLIDVAGATVDEPLASFLVQTPPGGVLLFERNIASAEQTRRFTAGLGEKAGDPAATPGSNAADIHLLVAVDQEGGPVRRLRDWGPLLPAARSVAQSRSAGEAENLAYAVGLALRDVGINMNLAPVLDVVEDPASFLYQRAYGGDPATVSRYGLAAIRGYAAAGVITSAKHFPGHGSAPGDTHEAEVRSALSREALLPHLEPFIEAISLGVPTVMVSHLMVEAYDPSRPASLSPAVVSELLRGELGYGGVVVSDSLGMLAAVHGTTVPESAVKALQAGADLLIVTGGVEVQREARDAIVRAVEEGELSPARLDEAVLRILVLKQTFGLTD